MRPVLRPVALVLAGLLGVSGAWLTWTVTAGAAQYRDDPRNARTLMETADPSRGRILSADGVVLAEDGPDGGRVYPEGGTYVHLVGFDAPPERSGIELTRRTALQSRDDGSITAWLRGLLGDDLGPPDIRLTVVHEVQQAAVDALGDRRGAVVAIDPRTGAVLAYASSPSFDPAAIVAGELDLSSEMASDALIDRVSDQVLPPGSTFKVVVTAAALEGGLGPGSEVAAGSSYTPPTGEPIRNFGGGGCGSDPIALADALAVSCNTAYARLAVDLGGEAVVAAAVDAGFNVVLPWETVAAVSSIPPGSQLDDDPPSLAQSGLGERDVRATPLLMAVIAAAVANDGVAMAPYVVDAVIAPGGEVLEAAGPERLARMFSTSTATALTEMMVEVVARGTGQPAALADVEVAGKTGTAEGAGGPHAWFIGFAPAADPVIAVAVLVEGGGSGGRVAGPIAAAVLAAWLGS